MRFFASVMREFELLNPQVVARKFGTEVEGYMVMDVVDNSGLMLLMVQLLAMPNRGLDISV
jgi:hypothetical protein